MSQILKERILLMLELEQLTDCGFIFRKKQENTKFETIEIVKAHKLLLGLASPVFNAMFFSANLEEATSNQVEIVDFTPEIFKLLLKYVYVHEIEFTNLEDALELYKIANKYEVTGLEKVCEDYITKNMTPEICCSAYELGNLYGNEKIEVKAMNVIETRTQEVLDSNKFLEAQYNTVDVIMRSEKLNIESEMVLLNALEKYTKHNWLSRVNVDDLIKQIRFLTVTIQDFNKDGMRSLLLTDRDKLAIFNKLISSNGTHYSYPKGFSMNIQRRQCEGLFRHRRY